MLEKKEDIEDKLNELELFNNMEKFDIVIESEEVLWIDKEIFKSVSSLFLLLLWGYFIIEYEFLLYVFKCFIWSIELLSVEMLGED